MFSNLIANFVLRSRCVNEYIDQGRSFDDIDIEISNCFFTRTSTYNGNGGVIYVNGGFLSMSVSDSVFINCIASNHGGSVYFISSKSFLRKICANSCSASVYHFSYLVSSLYNQIEYLSVSNCSYTTSGHHSICQDKGNQIVDHTNSSMNKAFQCAGILNWPPSSFISSYCTFSNNIVSHSVCIYYFSNSGEISYSNFLY